MDWGDLVRPLQGPGKDQGSEIGPIFILGDYHG